MGMEDFAPAMQLTRDGLGAATDPRWNITHDEHVTMKELIKKEAAPSDEDRSEKNWLHFWSKYGRV